MKEEMCKKFEVDSNKPYEMCSCWYRLKSEVKVMGGNVMLTAEFLYQCHRYVSHMDGDGSLENNSLSL